MFKGAGTALITPFAQDQSVDLNALIKIIQNQLQNKIDALIVLGTTGESPVIDYDERRKLISVVVEESIGKVPVIVGTGSNNTKKVIENNQQAEDLKADGLLIVNPYYNKGTQESLVEHYKLISEKTKLPIILYNVPSRTGMNILPETAIRIHKECKNVVAIKEASGNISQIAKLIAMKPSKLSVFSGNDDQTLPIMALGGDGVISVFSNPYPAQMKKITDAVLEKNLAVAQKYSNQYLEMMNALFVETSPAPVKYVMNKLGFCENVLRLPLTRASTRAMDIIDKELSRFS
ncbi:MAG: 4-hydroxy-tetrahydrodipicolinate synthase [Ignavibacteriaceae bacterium]|nr:4-hydroxy-tetrahydrodipicolinate synthase [Ignavibacteria bacterium]MBT8390580.1 4-hydroxy-tetrahydrodipicolinate synthase [Ignavibacteria bacterium]NNJ52987.1 4-hydroxy-tetrahydrodipicolinate synthase [Ignavibacteriaceae bacterium]